MATIASRFNQFFSAMTIVRRHVAGSAYPALERALTADDEASHEFYRIVREMEAEIDNAKGRMVQMIKWNPEADFSGTHLLGYLNEGLPFNETVARLKTLSGQDPVLGDGGDGKVSIEFIGEFEGHVFTLYDYKGDMKIHIGGHDGIDLDRLREELKRGILASVPSPYLATVTYGGDNTEHSWP